MKRQQTIIAIFALLIFALGATNANAQFGDFINKTKQKVDKVKQEAEKAKQEAKKIKQEIEQLGNPGKTGGGQNQQPAQPQAKNSDESWITISKTHTQHYELRYGSVNTLGCGDSIFATVNYREPMDNSGGYAVSMLVDGKVVLKEQMSGGSNTHVNQTIHIEVIPADDAVTGFPQVTLKNAKNILNKLTPGNHTIQIVVSLNDYPKNIAAVEFEYTGGAGCDARKPRNQNNQKETTKTNSQNQQVESQKPVMVELELQAACGTSRLITIDAGPYDRRGVLVQNGNTREKAAVGAQLFLKVDFGIDTTLIYTVGSDPFQVVKVCQ